MVRPQSIIRFEIFYLGSLVIGLIESAINWSATQEEFAKTPGAEWLTGWFLPALMLFSACITILLWYLVARRRSMVAKIIIVIFFVLSLPSLLQLFTGTLPLMITIFAIVGFVLNAASVWMLFRPDTKAWFSGKGEDLEDTFR